MAVWTVETYDPIAAMNRARDRKPATGGARQKVAKAGPRYADGDHVADCVARMRFATSEAIEQFRFDVHGADWVQL